MDSVHHVMAARAEPEDSPELTRFGGEFVDRAIERAFDGERMSETFRQARLLMIVSVILNALFYVSEWRFQGVPQFLVAIPTRTVMIFLAIVCLAILPRCRTPRELAAMTAGWMTINVVGVTALATSHGDVALFVVIMVPALYYLVVPTAFRWIVTAGAGCSLMLLAGYSARFASLPTAAGLAFAMLLLNVALAMAVSRRNRLERRHWLSARNERHTAAQLAESRELLKRMFDASPVPMVVTAGTGGKVLHVNDSAVALIESNREALIGATMTQFYADPEDQKRLAERLMFGASDDMEIEVRTATGDARFVLVKTAAVQTANGPINISGIIDISERREAQLSLERLAATDGLTGLPNRGAFFAAGRAEIERSERSGEPLSLMMIDLDHFKAINDGFGHQTGDRALAAFAALCRSRLCAQDLAARLGGEEFAILLPGATAAAAAAVAEQLRAGLLTLAIPGTNGVRLHASFGVAQLFAGERDLDAAIGRADRALYAAKRAGRNRVVLATEIAEPRRIQRPV